MIDQFDLLSSNYSDYKISSGDTEAELAIRIAKAPVAVLITNTYGIKQKFAELVAKEVFERRT